MFPFNKNNTGLLHRFFTTASKADREKTRNAKAFKKMKKIYTAQLEPLLKDILHLDAGLSLTEPELEPGPPRNLLVILSHENCDKRLYLETCRPGLGVKFGARHAQNDIGIAFLSLEECVEHIHFWLDKVAPEAAEKFKAQWENAPVFMPARRFF